MTTPLIESTSGAPTLQERAAAAGARREAEQEAYRLSRAESARMSAIADLVQHVSKHLGVVIDESAVQYSVGEKPNVTVEIDGLTFGMYRARAYDDLDDLCVSRPCATGCGLPVWVEITDYRLESLHRALTEPAAHSHDCLVKYDDDGEAITDRLGNPLLSAYERAKAAIADAIDVGDNFGDGWWFDAAALRARLAIEVFVVEERNR